MQNLIEKATEWAEQQALIIAREGTSLAKNELMLARKVGVMRAELIRVMLVPEVPQPDDLLLRQWIRQAGMPSLGAAGLTIQYGIYIREGCYSQRVLSHECRHVQQFEQAGSVAVGVQRYLEQVIKFGYRDAPFEVDARDHEVLT